MGKIVHFKECDSAEVALYPDEEWQCEPRYWRVAGVKASGRMVLLLDSDGAAMQSKKRAPRNRTITPIKKIIDEHDSVFDLTAGNLSVGNLSVERAYDARLSSAYAAGQFPDLQRRVQNVTAIISRSSIVAFCLVVAVSTSTNAEIANAIDKASGDSSFIIAQTEGMERREDRRDNRQDAREEGGLIGKDKRDAKQEGRQEGRQEEEKEKGASEEQKQGQ